MKKILLRTFISSILSGFCIVFGASVFLLCKGNGGTYGMQILGSLLFAIGLFTIIHFKLWLYTGRVGGLLDKDPKYIIRLIVCLLGNLLGTFVLALLIRIAGGSQADMLVEQSKAIVALKLEETAMQAMIRSILCGMMIYVAVKGHAICEYSLGKVLFAFLPICLFILCGYEHVVANGAYFTFAGVFNVWSGKDVDE